MMDREFINKIKKISWGIALIFALIYYALNISPILIKSQINDNINYIEWRLNYTNVDPASKELFLSIIRYNAQEYIKAMESLMLPITPLQFVGIELVLIGLPFVLSLKYKDDE